MKGKTEHCGWKSAPQQKPIPCDRYKHACVLCRGFVYLHGGWNMTSLRDFWRYNIVKNEWEMLDCSGDGPEELEEHSVVAYKGNLYVFLVEWWILLSHKQKLLSEHMTLIPQDGQSAVTYQQRRRYRKVVVCFQPNSEHRPRTSAWPFRSGLSYRDVPLWRTDGLSEQKDLWKWDFVSSTRSNIRTSQGPPPVVGQASIVCKDSMLIFGGGISNSSPNDDLWKYLFHMQTWNKLSSTANFPPKMYHCILGIGVDFQTTSDFTNTCPSHWKNDQDHGQLVPIPRHTHFGNYFCQRYMHGVFGSKESNATEMKTFSLPLEPGGFCAFQTTSEAELDPNRDKSLLLKDKSLPLFPSSETLAAAQVVGEEEGSDPATGGEELGSHTNTLLAHWGQTFVQLLRDLLQATGVR